MNILKNHHSSTPETHPPAPEDHNTSTSLAMPPRPLQSVGTNGTPMNGADDIVYSPHEIDHSLLLFTNTVFFDTNLGRYLDQYEDFGCYEHDGYEDPASQSQNREYFFPLPLCGSISLFKKVPFPLSSIYPVPCRRDVSYISGFLAGSVGCIFVGNSNERVQLASTLPESNFHLTQFCDHPGVETLYASIYVSAEESPVSLTVLLDCVDHLQL